MTSRNGGIGAPGTGSNAMRADTADNDDDWTMMFPSHCDVRGIRLAQALRIDVLGSVDAMEDAANRWMRRGGTRYGDTGSPGFRPA